MAVCVTDFVQGTLMLIGLLIVPLVAYLTLSGSLSDLLTQSGAPGGAAAFLNPFENGERPYTFVEIFSQLAWGLGYCGMPHILTRFMAVKSEKELKKSSAIAIVWDILSLTAACFIGIIAVSYTHLDVYKRQVRVWGGGYYPEDWFFDLCDELGLMVWQDFMFACSVYELTPEFEANIRQEFIDNIKRLRHHASLALWCGNNEMEMFVKQGTWVTKPTEMRDYLFMYERIIPEVLSEYDPDTFYWPASPSSRCV